MMRTHRHLVVLFSFILTPETLAWGSPPDGNGSIRSRFRDSDIVITTTSRVAGAVHSLTWGGKEFIDSTDHGRQLQSASNFDAGSEFTNETFNPTEAGSLHDGAGDRSTSRLLHYLARGNQLQTTNQMAFWLRPGQTSDGHSAKNVTDLSDHLLTKRVTIGFQDLPNVIEYNVTFSVPIGETHRYAQYEAVTGYMPAEFCQFLAFDPSNGQFTPLSDGPGEQPMPVVLATKDSQFAMGIYSPEQPSSQYPNAGYGRWNFESQNVVKWNCVFRHRDASGIAPGDYFFKMFVIIGTLEDVRASMVALHAGK